jgi:hypothetical protein
MRWQILAALTNGWLWLLAVLSVAVLVVSSAPLWFTLMTGAAVLLGGAGVQGAVEWNKEKQRRLGPDQRRTALPESPGVADPDAQAVIQRVRTAAARVRRIREDDLEAPADVLVSTEVAADGAVDAMDELGRQVDRVNRAMTSIDPRAVRAELSRVEAQVAQDKQASAELTEQRRAITESLRAQLSAYDRLSRQRVLVLTRMQSAAVSLEGLAVRLGEICALYSARHDDTVTTGDLRSVASEMDTLRVDLVEANASLRQSLRSLG